MANAQWSTQHAGDNKGRGAVTKVQKSTAPRTSLVRPALFLGSLLLMAACTRPAPGPDKQFGGMMSGAAMGAGTGAITGFQLGGVTGPGAAVGAGFGAAVGAIQGAGQDLVEDQMFELADATHRERAVSVAQEILADHYARRVELHPTRDIFPADMFFKSDTAVVKPSGRYVLDELARMNKERLTWSRLVVASYVKASDPQSHFALDLAQRRSNEVVNQLVHAGLEPRRLEARGVVVSTPILVDPSDDPLRYSQAVEIIPLDR